MNKIKFKKLRDNAVLPKRANPTDAGLDLTACEVDYDFVNKKAKIYFGVAVEIPEGYVGLLFPRSSVHKKDMRLANSVGVIDSDYRGEIIGIFDLRPDSVKLYELHERAAQLVIVPISLAEPEWSDELSDTSRGSGGFGSSGK